MRPVAFTACALALLAVATPALAQSLPFDGFYAGVNGGYSLGNNTIRTFGQTAANAAAVADGTRPSHAEMDSEGFMGGIQLGHNWQRGNYVFGLETDAQYTDIHDTRNFVTTGVAFPGTRDNRFRRSMSWFGTSRMRLGYAWDDSLVYATGGLAYGRLREDIMFSGPRPASTLQYASTHNRTNLGFALGGGFEHALDDHWSIKTEYLFFDLNRTQLFSNAVAGTGAEGTGYVAWFDNRGQIARVGINYRID